MADAPKIQIDSDWKAEAQKEKERLAKHEAEKQRSGDGAGQRGEALPPADFRTIVGMLAQQAIMGLGVLADRKSGGIIIDLEGARFSIDLLDILEQKTTGNLTPEEQSEIKQILGELRSRYVQVATMVARQAQNAPDPQAAGQALRAAKPGNVDPIITE